MLSTTAWMCLWIVIEREEHLSDSGQVFIVGAQMAAASVTKTSHPAWTLVSGSRSSVIWALCWLHLGPRVPPRGKGCCKPWVTDSKSHRIVWWVLQWSCASAFAGSRSGPSGDFRKPSGKCLGAYSISCLCCMCHLAETKRISLTHSHFSAWPLQTKTTWLLVQSTTLNAKAWSSVIIKCSERLQEEERLSGCTKHLILSLIYTCWVLTQLLTWFISFVPSLFVTVVATAGLSPCILCMCHRTQHMATGRTALKARFWQKVPLLDEDTAFYLWWFIINILVDIVL